MLRFTICPCCHMVFHHETDEDRKDPYWHPDYYVFQCPGCKQDLGYRTKGDYDYVIIDGRTEASEAFEVEKRRYREMRWDLFKERR